MLVWWRVLLLLATCNVPVFRYALERWRPAPYPLTVFFSGERPKTTTLDRSANVDIDEVELRAPFGLLDGVPPFMVLHYPDGTPAWAGMYTEENLRAAVDSPARREIAKRLMQGDSAVWLLIESGDKSKDDAADAALAAEFGKLQDQLKLPERGEQDPALRSDVPLRISFSTVRLSRTDPRERVFMAIFDRADGDIAAATKPVALPIFGRGRALWPLIGAQIGPKAIGEAAAFVVGACSCEVKDLNPGLDLLISAEWDSIFDRRGAETERPVAPVLPASIPIPPGASKLPPQEPSPPAPAERTVPMSLVFAALVVAGMLVSFRLRKKEVR